MKTYNVTITGKTPLLMHSDDIEWADRMAEWKANPKNKNVGKPGDDRSPAWRWIGNVYADNEFVSIPADNLMRCLMEGGAMVPVPGGKNGKTFKSQTQSGLIVGAAYWPLRVNGKVIERQHIDALLSNEDFADHKVGVKQLGFSLFVKRAKIGSSKHIRVRPRFDDWSASGEIIVTDSQITKSVLLDILAYAGQYKGLCDWRPGGRTPGSFGMFSAALSE